MGTRPGVGTLPGLANRPGIDSRPAVGNAQGIGNRAGAINQSNLTSNRAGAINRSNVANNVTVNQPITNVRGNNRVGVGVDPGYGVRPPASNNWRGAYGGYHRGWVNGYWHGDHNNNSWNWGSFALGAATGVAGWGLASSYHSWGYSSYANPYYSEEAAPAPIVIEQTVAGGEPQTVTVPAVSYDYTQPIDTQAAPPPAEVSDPAVAQFDAARAAFRAGDYAGALQQADAALKVLPNDATLHEFRALVLFAVGQYDLAAGPLYSVLAVGPGWDWTTMIGLYPTADVYTRQLRALEQHNTDHPNSSASRFVLAYHYLTMGNTDSAVAQLKHVVSLTPGDTLSAQLIKQFAKPAETPAPSPASAPAPAPATTPAQEGTLAGSWSASPNKDTTIALQLQPEGTFAWKVTSRGKSQDLTGNWSSTNGVLTLAQSNQGGAMVGNVTWQAEDRFGFRALGTGPDDPGLTFTH